MRFLPLAFLAIPAVALASPEFEGEAPIAYLIDLQSGTVLFEKDADRQIPPASMAKMMTAHVAFALIDSGKLDEDEICTVDPDTWRQWSGPAAGSTMFLSPGEDVSVENLLFGVVTVSGNDASTVLAECIAGTEDAFVERMNDKAEELGMSNSRFGNAKGWPDEGASMVTARDLGTLAASTIDKYPELYAKYYGREAFTWGETGGGTPITQPNRNPFIDRLEGGDGLKTGHTEEAGYGFTGSAIRDGRRLVMVVAGLDSYGGRASESVRFMEWGFNAWETEPLFGEGAEIGSAKVQLGSSGSVSLVAPRDLAATYPAGSDEDPRAVIRYEGPLKAPIAAGDHVADLVVNHDGAISVLPLVAGEDVEEAGFFRRVWLGFKQLFGMA
ncbi:D-alanyl-D-alanine carboxypeptidase family protein [Sphingomicrobium sediminis]|uniref:serine-type D-Ala-D-Ala carboxypeptidase n=1 Tax=Sphingomicrobium sediminis TaxID=2950949 RepID=A0A9X2EF44_9SPHN|nr:D-alanyl-D-alanine carboxypeptidase family protein [Sphingomicrobium sediminis]MCM8556773.1 D-alanyl-D-alanine carboxypeptidase [Sphingomicrobium sediminis]